ncbi:3-phosphoshikimate 1-carboxyvinyltransferase [Candidatus Daviesbacteria bacterium]|nr:3-phosphoshikimate 1-carboxyvinyltransferase [Candidatus Daviesbacteria bacterium]
MSGLQLLPLSKPINASVEIPGSKSYTNRALFIASLVGPPVKILKPLISDDTKAMIRCLEILGVKISFKNNCLEVLGNLQNIPNHIYHLNAGLSGTTLRFLLALSTVIPGTKILFGEEGLNKRPIEELVSALRQLGAKIEYLEKAGYPPIKILPTKLKPGIITIKGSISSQYVSALLMIAPLVGRVTINIQGKQISTPYIDMTIDIMKYFGIEIVNNQYKKYQVKSLKKYSSKKYLVEGDLSSAAYFLAIAALTKSKITVKNINPSSKQADMKFVQILKELGNEVNFLLRNKISFDKNQITITGKEVKPVNVDMADCPDQIQTMAVLAAFTKGITKIYGISSLRIKETDRVFALKTELKKMNIKTKVTKNTLTIFGGNPKPASIDTYGDHRMAMSFAVAGAKLPGMKINNSEVVSKTFPDFWKKLNSIGMKTEAVNQKNIVLIGMRGSGKTTVAKILAKKLNTQYLELDEILVKKMNMSIMQIVDKYGWDFFRDKESEIVQQVSDRRNLVISTGGGVILRPKNIEALKRNGLLIFLNASVKTLSNRIGGKIGYDPKMPALTNKKNSQAEIAYIFKQREELYKQAADQIIETGDKTLNQLADLIVSRLKESTTCIVIGDPIKHSLSPKMHNAGYKALGIDNHFSFISQRVTKENLKSILEQAKTSNIKGVSVTVPYKETIMKYLDKIEKNARNIGAVNTIVNDNGKLTGFNTDWTGAITALENKTSLKGKKVTVIGAGGAARAIVYGLKKKESSVKIFNRSIKHAKELANEFGCQYFGLNSLEQIQDAEIIINATSVGTNEDKSPVNKKLINKNHIVLDVVYSPKETRLIKDSLEKGAKVIYGYEMLLYQGVAQFELYTGMKAPVAIMRKTLEENAD